MENDVWIGQTWDGPALSLKKDGKPVTYQAPKEGAIAWLDGLSLMKAAKNVDQAYEFLNYLHTPEASAAVAEGSGYNPVVKRRRRAALRRAPRRTSRKPIPATRWRTLALAGRSRPGSATAQPVRRQVQVGLMLKHQDLAPAPEQFGAGFLWNHESFWFWTVGAVPVLQSERKE